MLIGWKEWRVQSLARKLYRSVKNRDPEDLEWFEEALMRTANGTAPLERLLWEAVTEIVEELETQKGHKGTSFSGRRPD